jgi:dopamine beta-monooxygenase
MKVFLFVSFLLQWLVAQAKDASSYFGGSEVDGYTAWLQTTGASSYDKTAFVESTQAQGAGVALHWTIQDEAIQLAVAARATGWVGFGLGESGSMLGADIVLYDAESNELVDSYVLDQAMMPYRDECQSWTLINSTVENGFIIFEASRPLDTKDTQDRVILDDSDELVPSTRVLTAWGDSTSPSNHGKNTARGAIRFFGNSSAAQELEAFTYIMATEAEGNFTIRANNYVIPTDRTTYAHFCVSNKELSAMNVDLDQDLHAIGFEPFIDNRTKMSVHHYVLKAMSDPWNTSLLCDDFPGFEIAYVWAPGELPLSLPLYLGSPLGLTGFQSYQLQIHYDNPDGTADMTDDSGLRVYYTSKKRQFDLGVFATGDPNVVLAGSVVSLDGGLAQHIFDCSGLCSSNLSAPVTVIREHLHMHAVGVSMTNAQIRNSQVVHQGKVEYWDFFQQGGFVVQQPPFELQPGDAFRTVCNYDIQRNETWGLGSNDEMCMAFMYYYPRHVVPSEYGDLPFMCGLGLEDVLPNCVTTHEVTPDFAESRQLDRLFGTTSDVCDCCDSATPSEPIGSSGVDSPTLSDPTGPTSPSNPKSSAMTAILKYVAAGVIVASLVPSF